MSILFFRSEFSLGQSTLSPKDAINAAKEGGYSHALLADSMTLSALMETAKVAKSSEIGMLTGCRITIADQPDFEWRVKFENANPNAFNRKAHRNYSFVVIAKNESGIQDMYQLLTVANKPQYLYQNSRTKNARLSLEDFVEIVGKGNLIVMASDIDSVMMRPDYLRIIKTVFLATKENFVAALYPIDSPVYDRINKRTFGIANKTKAKIVSFYPAYYLENQSDAKDALYRLVNNIHEDNAVFAQIPHCRDNQPNVDLGSMIKAMCDRLAIESPIDELNQQDWLVEQCEYQWHQQEPAIPQMYKDEYAVLMDKCKAGLNRIFNSVIFGYTPPQSLKPIYIERLKYEFNTLKSMGFGSYFLLVEDLMNHCRKNEIPIGAGRGSAGGSLLAYCLGITNVDPIRFDLLFERFINPSRSDLPDIDLDFSRLRRQEVIDYLQSRHGNDRVAAIPNYTFLGAKSCVRDLARIADLPKQYLEAASMIGMDEQNRPLSELVEHYESLAKLKADHPMVFSQAEQLQSKMKGFSKHAAGIIVSSVPLVERTALERRNHDDSIATISFDKRSCEDNGLIKLDILGLATLDVIDICINNIAKHTGKMIDICAIPLDDPKTLEVFHNADTNGIFQFDGFGMKEMLKKLRQSIEPLSFDTMIAAVALYRPAALQSGAADIYIETATGCRRFEPLHPLLEDLLRPTHGVMVYQEQTMQAVQILAGFSMADADNLRKAVSKKKIEQMLPIKEQFIKGCLENNNIGKDESERIWNSIESFAGYGFNKSHSACYALCAYQAMYLKAHYPAYFYAAALSGLGSDKTEIIASDAMAHGIQIVAPDCNQSQATTFEVGELNGKKVIYAPMVEIFKVGVASALKLIEMRAVAGGKVSNREQMKVGEKMMETLEKIGFFSSIDKSCLPLMHPNRARDQAELLPNLRLNVVKCTRPFIADATTQIALNQFYEDLTAFYPNDEIVQPLINSNPKIMVAVDYPTAWDTNSNCMSLKSKANADLLESLQLAGFGLDEIYLTSVSKIVKDRSVSYDRDAENLAISQFRKELEIINPPLVLVMGKLGISAVSNHAKPNDLQFKNQYFPEKDLMAFYGTNMGVLYHNPDLKPETMRKLNALTALIHSCLQD